MPSQTPFAFASRLQLSTADFQLFRANSFRLIQFRKNASANPLESHTFKTKDLKPFRFTHFRKKGGGAPDSVVQPQRAVLPIPSTIQPHTSNLCSSLTPLDSALTSKRAPKSFTSNTYEKHTQGEGVSLASEHESRITGHERFMRVPTRRDESRVTASRASRDDMIFRPSS